MATPPIVESFRALQTTAARHAVIAALADEFSSYDWRQIKALADAKSLQFDIIGNLPAELVFHVFSFLDVSTPFRLQTVSRRWCNLLKTPEILKPNLRNWYNGTVDLEDAKSEDLLQRAQSIHSFRTGNFLECAVYWNSGCNDNILVEDFLIDVYNEVIEVTNLLTGKYWQVSTEGRTKIQSCSASDQLVAYWTNFGTCHVFDIVGTPTAKFRLPPHMCKFKACRERTIISGGILGDYFEFSIWDSDRQQAKVIRLEKSLFSTFTACLDKGGDMDRCCSYRILPNPRSRTFTLFMTQTCETPICGHALRDMSIHYALVTFDGQLVQQKKLVIPLPAEPKSLGRAMIKNISPVDRTGGFRFVVFCRYDYDIFLHSFYFDENLQTFRDSERPTLYSDKSEIAWWEDAFFQASTTYTAGPKGHLQIHFKHLGNSEQDSHAQPFRHDNGAYVEEIREGMASLDIRLVLNDKFAIIGGLDHLYIFSFTAAKAKTTRSFGGPEPSLQIYQERQRDIERLWARSVGGSMHVTT